MGIFEILKAMGGGAGAPGAANPNAPIGAQGSIVNALTGGAPRQGSVFAGLQGLFGPGAQQGAATPQPGAIAPQPGTVPAQPGAPASQPQPAAAVAPDPTKGAPVAPVQKNFAALAAQYGLPSDGYLAQQLFG